jgi:hypothetical protein
VKKPTLKLKRFNCPRGEGVRHRVTNHAGGTSTPQSFPNAVQSSYNTPSTAWLILREGSRSRDRRLTRQFLRAQQDILHLRILSQPQTPTVVQDLHRSDPLLVGIRNNRHRPRVQLRVQSHKVLQLERLVRAMDPTRYVYHPCSLFVFTSASQYDPKDVRDTGNRQNPRFTAPLPGKSNKPLPPPVSTTQTVQPQYVWDTKDPDFDDPLHNPDPIRDAALERSIAFFSLRGWLNATALFTLLLGLIVLFVGYPVASEFSRKRYAPAGFNLGGINGTGQVPKLPNMPSLIDIDTPSDAYSITLGETTYNLVFSDEFNVDGRSFYPGDDPYWEAVDLHYW